MQSNLSFKRSNCTITLVALQKNVKCKDEIVHFDPLQLFSRLTSIENEQINLKNILNMNLFNDRSMRESHKSDLKNILFEKAHNFETYPDSKIVIDGGALLHQVS